jgi:ribose transport system permease protein
MSRHVSPPLIRAAAVTLVVVVFFTITTPGFTAESDVRVIIDGLLTIGLASLGLGVTMIAGEFDLSVPATATLAGLLAMRAAGPGMVIGILVGAGVGLLIGVIQGGIVRVLRISSLVLTLGTSLVITGGAYIAAGQSAGSSASIAAPSLGFAETLQRPLWIFDPGSLVAIALFVIVGLALQFSSVGRDIVAAGGGRKEATAAGVKVGRAIVIAFAVSGVLAGLLGGLVSAETGGASPTAFTDLLLNAVTAAFIGGVTLRGGEGSALGIALGVITLGAILNGLNLHSVPYYVDDLAIGGVLVGFVMWDVGAEGIARHARGFMSTARRVAGREPHVFEARR